MDHSSPAADSELIRLSINLDGETAEALDQLAKKKGLSYTDVVRNAVNVYHFLSEEEKAGRLIVSSTKHGCRPKTIMLMH